MPKPKGREDSVLDLDDLTRPERLRTAALAAISALPAVGGPLARIFDAELPSRRWERLKEFLRELKERLERIDARLDASVVTRDEVVELLEAALVQSAQTTSTTKHEILAGLAATSLALNPDVEEMRFFLAKVEQLSPLHIQLLLFASNPDAFVGKLGIDPAAVKHLSFRDVIGRVFPGIDPEVMKSAWQDLYVHGFLNTEATIFGTMLSSSGTASVIGRLRPLGARFVDYCMTGAKSARG